MSKDAKEKAQPHMAIKPWEDGEEDTELFTEIENLFEWNKMFDDFDKRLAALKQWMDEEATSEEEKAAIEKGADNLTRLIEKQKEKGQRSVPGLKVLSAVAVCKTYKDSEETLNPVSQGRRMVHTHVRVIVKKWRRLQISNYGVDSAGQLHKKMRPTQDYFRMMSFVPVCVRIGGYSKSKGFTIKSCKLFEYPCSV